MSRINIHERTYGADGEDWKLDGWFNPDKALTWRGQEQTYGRTDLLLTKQGQWLYGHITYRQGQGDRYERIIPDEAREWFIRGGSEYDEDIARYFGELEEERGPGRPTEGTRIDVRVPADLLAKVDEQRERDGDSSRAETIRKILARNFS